MWVCVSMSKIWVWRHKCTTVPLCGCLCKKFECGGTSAPEYTCVCLCQKFECGGTSAPQYPWRDQRTIFQESALSLTLVPGIELGSSGWHGKHFACWAILVALPGTFDSATARRLYFKVTKWTKMKAWHFRWTLAILEVEVRRQLHMKMMPIYWRTKLKDKREQLPTMPASSQRTDNSWPPGVSHALPLCSCQWLPSRLLKARLCQRLAVAVVTRSIARLWLYWRCSFTTWHVTFRVPLEVKDAKGIFPIFHRWDTSARKEQCIVKGQTVQQQDRANKSSPITPIQHFFSYHSIDYRKYGNFTTTTHLGEKSIPPLTLNRNTLLWISSFP